MDHTGKLVLLLPVIVLILLSSCTRMPEESGQDKEEHEVVITTEFENYSGVYASQWYFDKEHQKDVIDIINFDNRERIINGTTVCLDGNGDIISTKDTAVLTLPPKSRWTWIPDCPGSAMFQTVNITPLDE